MDNERPQAALPPAGEPAQVKGMSPNAPLTPEGRRRLCERIDQGAALSHVADAGGISRQALGKWYGRWLNDGMDGLYDQSSRPRTSPSKTPDDIEHMVLDIRRVEKWGATRISQFLALEFDIKVAGVTVQRILKAHGISRLRDMDMPTGESKREVIRYEYDKPGGMVHVDIKKVGRIPKGGGHWVHGRDSEAAKASRRVAARGPRMGYEYIHNAVDDHSRLAYSEVLSDEKGATAAGFWLRAAFWFQLNGINRIEKVLTDNGACYRSHDFNSAVASTETVHKYTRPHTPRTNGKVERFNLIMKNEWLYRSVYDSSEDRLAYLPEFLNTYNTTRAHSALGYKAPMSRLPGVEYHPVEAQTGDFAIPNMAGYFGQDSLFTDDGEVAE